MDNTSMVNASDSSSQNILSSLAEVPGNLFHFIITLPSNIFNYIESLNWDQRSAIIFIVIMGAILYYQRSKLEFQPVVGRIIYAFLYKTKVGIKTMGSFAASFRGPVRVFGYVGIGLGFLGMIFMTFQILFILGYLLFKVFMMEEVKNNGVAFVLPFQEIPGIGYLSFWHFLISIFIVALIHEFGHGIVARSHNIKVKTTGLAVFSVFLPLFPAAFVEPDEKQMSKKKKSTQLSVMGAGPAMNILLFLIMLFAIVPAFSSLGDDVMQSEGFYIYLLNDTYPAAQAGMQNNTVITAINGKVISNYREFSAEISDVSSNEDISIVANGTTYNFITTEHPNNPSKGFIGITPTRNNVGPKEGVSKWQYEMYMWVMELLFWMTVLNIGIGLMNLLPMGPLDGGRMLLIVLSHYIKDQKLVQRIWSYISLFFFGILIFGLLLNYAGHPAQWHLIPGRLAEWVLSLF